MRRALLLCAVGALGCQSGGPHSGGHVSIPEPMVFDLVRGLGAKKGELEFNALVLHGLDSDDPVDTLVAPEVEYAVLDGLALELEFPFEAGDLVSVKGAVQWTLGEWPDTGFIHGTQLLAERLVEKDAWDLSLLYVPGFRFDDTWSVLGMFGAQSIFGPEVDDDLAALANVTLFAELSDRLALGFEVNSVLFADTGWAVMLMPQLHYDVSKHFTLQVGAGVSYIDGQPPIPILSDELVPEGESWFPQVSVRLVFEF
jgi:opacity protein-like surface antigen